MKKAIFIHVALSMVLSSCLLSLRKVEYFLTAKDANELFERRPVEIVEGYQLAQLKDISGFVVTSPLRRAPDGIYEANTLASHVRRIGWSQHFIVVEEQDQIQKVWKIIVVQTEYVYYCTEKTVMDMCESYDEFMSLRIEVGVPNDIELRDVVDAYEELVTNK